MSGLRRQGRHHVERVGTALRFTSPLQGGDSNGQDVSAYHLLNIPKKCPRNLEGIQKNFREDQLVFQKKYKSA